MVGCCSVGCNNSSTKDKEKLLLFHRIPKTQKKEWAVHINRLDAAGNLWVPENSSNRLCSVGRPRSFFRFSVINLDYTLYDDFNNYY